jgi:hypothetical protein
MRRCSLPMSLYGYARGFLLLLIRSKASRISKPLCTRAEFPRIRLVGNGLNRRARTFGMRAAAHPLGRVVS